MVILALLSIPFVGTLFALSAQRQIAHEASLQSPFDRPFYRGLLYVIAVYIPVLAFIYYDLPDWSLAYLIEPVRLPSTFGIVLASLSFSGYFFAYLGTQSLLRAHRPVTAWLAASQLGLASVTFAALFTDELSQVGSYYAFHAGISPKLDFSNGLAEVLVCAGLLVVPACGIFIWNWWEDRRYPPLEVEDSKW